MRTTSREFGTAPIRQLRPEWFSDARGAAIGMYIGKWGLTVAWQWGGTEHWSLGLRCLPRLDFERIGTHAIATLGIDRLDVTAYHPARDVTWLEDREPRFLRRYHSMPLR